MARVTAAGNQKGGAGTRTLSLYARCSWNAKTVGDFRDDCPCRRLQPSVLADSAWLSPKVIHVTAEQRRGAGGPREKLREHPNYQLVRDMDLRNADEQGSRTPSLLTSKTRRGRLRPWATTDPPHREFPGPAHAGQAFTTLKQRDPPGRLRKRWTPVNDRGLRSPRF
jgi:hypothetical protein